MGTAKIWTPDRVQFLLDHYKGRPNVELTNMINEHFNINLTPRQVESYKNVNHLVSGITGRYEKGNVPFNKGKRMSEYVSPEMIEKIKKTQFKNGHTPTNTKPVGSQRIDEDGCLLEKYEDGWKLVHRIKYEEYHNVKLKNTDLVIFMNRNPKDMRKENLMKISRGELLFLNRYGYISDDADITQAGLNLSKIAQVIKLLKEKEEKDR